MTLQNVSHVGLILRHTGLSHHPQHQHHISHQRPGTRLFHCSSSSLLKHLKHGRLEGGRQVLTGCGHHPPHSAGPTLCIFDRIIFTCCSVPSSLYCWTMSIFVFLPEFYHIAAAKFFKFMWLSQASCNCLNFLAIIWKCQAAVSSLCVGSLCSTFSFLEGLDAVPRCLFSLSNCMCDRFSVYLTWNLLS